MLKEFYDMKEEMENSSDKKKFQFYIKTMLSYCLKCRKNTESKIPNAIKTKNGRIMLLSKCTVCDSKNRKLLKSKKLEYK